jgi:hypothetical protein
VLFPKPGTELSLTAFPGIAERFLASQGYGMEVCATEDEARRRIPELLPAKKWPCYFFSSDTQGEKEAEEFYGAGEDVDLERFQDIGVIRQALPTDFSRVEEFLAAIRKFLEAGRWDKGDLAEQLLRTVPEFQHKAAGRSLDERM